ncbi:hypothetical protein TNCV_3470271 [Trichonephila clavipes]|nr:hypothetical protein TNCV_3470271 [Trichonephila clavipes]
MRRFFSQVVGQTQNPGVKFPNKLGTERKLDLTGASEMNRLYPNSRRESIKEDKYLNTLPRRGGGWRKKRPNENKTKVRHEGRNGGAQGRGLNSPKQARYSFIRNMKG